MSIDNSVALPAMMRPVREGESALFGHHALIVKSGHLSRDPDWWLALVIARQLDRNANDPDDWEEKEDSADRPLRNEARRSMSRRRRRVGVILSR